MRLYDIARNITDDVTRGRLNNRVVVDVSDIAQPILNGQHHKPAMDVVAEAPSLVPPWESMWLEYKLDRRTGVAIEAEALDLGSMTSDEASRAWQFWGSRIESVARIGSRAPMPMEAKAGPIRWIVTASIGTVSPQGYGAVAYLFMALGLDGQIVANGDNPLDPVALLFFADEWEHERAMLMMIATAIHVYGFSVGLMHCKNVRLADGTLPPERVRKKQERRLESPLVQFKTLEIELVKASGERAEGSPAWQSSDRSYHICRGHFKTFTKEKPRFGRDVGTFWYSAHVRGSTEAGTVYKDYRVKA